MQFKTGAEVVTQDGKNVGQVDRVVIDPVTNEVTHIVVRKGLIFTSDKVLALHALQEATEDRIVLRANVEDLEGEPDFEERLFIPLDEPGASDEYVLPTPGYVGRTIFYPPIGSYGLWPAGPMQYGAATVPPPYVVQTERNIPDGAVALEAGADVLDPQGDDIGDVEEVIADPESDRVTHVVVVRGGLLNRNRRLVPVNWISRIEEKQIHLAVDNGFLDRLPPYEPEG